MLKQKLNDLVFHLDTLSYDEVKELEKHFLQFSRDCGVCQDCELRYHVMQVYKLHRFQHQHNRRHSIYDEMAETFVHKHYDSSIFNEDDRDRFFTENGYVSK
jgi:Na+-translocating ferredoxin:NAD+ oxidoreductase RnfC subunit